MTAWRMLAQTMLGLALEGSVSVMAELEFGEMKQDPCRKKTIMPVS